VLFSSRYAAVTFPDETQAAFPAADQLDGGSFWMRAHSRRHPPLVAPD
jgi:hypothetical protein